MSPPMSSRSSTPPAMSWCSRTVSLPAHARRRRVHRRGRQRYRAKGQPPIDWDRTWPKKGGYPDFMLKEIHEQPRVVRDTLVGRMTPAGELRHRRAGPFAEELNDIDRVYVIACGTSYHAGLIAKNSLRAGSHPHRGGGGQRVPLSQPHHYADARRGRVPVGETADTLAAMSRRAHQGAKVFGITTRGGQPRGA